MLCKDNTNYFSYLDSLRKSGITNMFGATSFLMDSFHELSEREAAEILICWMKDRGRADDQSDNTKGLQ